MSTIYLISCSKSKRKESSPLPAKSLYTGKLFQKSLQYAEQQNPDNILVLSAKYHVVKLNQKLEYYDLYLADLHAAERKEWAATVLKKITKMGYDLEKDHFIFLTGKDYYHYLMPSMKNAEVVGDSRGIGYKLQWFNQHIMELEEE
ncbi:MAG: hypothetical protein K6A41_04605 [Bacteroidales bacterium]|nr:hypothetical protein [Bacteroidales bacterium]